MSRNPIRMYPRAGIVEPEVHRPDRPGRLDPYAEKLTARLLSEPRRSPGRTAKQVHAGLVQLGFDGSYEHVAAFVRDRKDERQRAAYG